MDDEQRAEQGMKVRRAVVTDALFRHFQATVLPATVFPATVLPATGA